MNPAIRQHIITICDEKIEKKGKNVGLSFYAFFLVPSDGLTGLAVSLIC